MSDWIDILAYRDFCDVPRMFLIVVEGRTLLFDCAFDDKLDDYPADYTVYELRNFHADALPRDWTELSRGEAARKGRIPVRSVVFDTTRRKRMKCTECRELLA